jgi:endonuclease/exonuclease/phosphatase family metal-dependent hydrolase
MAGISKVTALSLNCRWPGFGSTKREALPWNVRCDALVKSIKAAKPDVISAQELGDHARGGQAEELFDALGFKYHAHVLNAVGWNPDRFRERSTQEITLNDHGQYPGRTAIVTKLLDHDGNRFRIGSTHLATHSNSPSISDARAAIFRAEQMHTVLSKINDDTDDWPMLLGMDSNSRASDRQNKTPRSLAHIYGWDWPEGLTGIDLVLANYSTFIDSSTKIELGTASDHDGRLVVAHTTKK